MPNRPNLTPASTAARPRPRRVAAVLAAAALAVGCTSDADPIIDGDGPEAEVPLTDGDQEVDGDGDGDGDEDAVTSDGVMLSIDHRPLQTPERALGDTLDVVVLADGTVFTGGVTTSQYLGPLLHPIVTGTLDAGTLDDLVAAVAALDPEADYEPGPTPAVELPETTIRWRTVDGDEVVIVVPAFGPGPRNENVAPRIAVAAVVRTATDAAMLAAGTPWDPTGYRILQVPDTPTTPPGEQSIDGDGTGDPLAMPGIQAQVLTVPFPVDLVDGCATVTDPTEVGALTELFRTGRETDVVQLDGDVVVVPAPLWPGDPGCDT